MKASGKLALDTNAVIAYREGIREVCSLIDGTDVIFLPVTVLGELLYGALNSNNVNKNKEAVEKLLLHCIVIHIDEAVAARYASVRFNLKKIGNPIPENDIWVAAACLEHAIPLISRDGHFNQIQGLDVINWENPGRI